MRVNLLPNAPHDDEDEVIGVQKKYAVPMSNPVPYDSHKARTVSSVIVSDEKALPDNLPRPEQVSVIKKIVSTENIKPAQTLSPERLRNNQASTLPTENQQTATKAPVKQQPPQNPLLEKKATKALVGWPFVTRALIVVVGVVVGLSFRYLWLNWQNRQAVELEKQVVLRQEELNALKTSPADARFLAHRLRYVGKYLDSANYQPLFSVLNDSVLPTTIFTKVEVVSEKEMMVSGEADLMSTVATTYASFLNHELVNNVELAQSIVNVERGVVQFSYKVLLK